MLLERSAWLKLKEHGFVKDPFDAEAVRAEADDLINDAFVGFPYFDSIKGKPLSPGPRFVFGGRGGGKTALRLTLHRQFDESLRQEKNRVLAVTYNDFDPVLERAAHDPAKVRLRYHIEYIVSLIVKRLFWLMVDEKSSLEFSRLKQEHKRLFVWYAEYFGIFQPWQLDYFKGEVEGLEGLTSKESVVSAGKGLLQVIADLTSPVASQIVKLFNEMVKVEKPIPIQPRDVPLVELLDGMLRISQGLGFEAIYVLVDDVDEPQYYGEKRNFSPAFELIRVLAAAPKILGMPGLIFKFFLPIEIRAQCLKSLRLDKFAEQVITWKYNDFRDLLRRRLRAASEGQVNSLVCLCAEDLSGKDSTGIDELLVDFAKEKGNPRALLYLGNELLSEHFREPREAGDKITRATWHLARQRAEEVLQ